jgi:uncharacterized protein
MATATTPRQLRSLNHEGGAAPLVERVCFRADGVSLAGNLYHPRRRDSSLRLPAVVVSGTWTSVKEQMADRYAAELARRGMVALSFDFTGFGLSGGEPREVESASRKARDIHQAVSFLHAHPRVDPGRVGALAICASAGYTVANAVEDLRVRAIALIAPWLHDAAIVREVYGGEEGVRDRQRAGEAARELYDQTGVTEYVPAASADDPRAAMPMAIDFYTDPQRGALAGWPNRYAVMAWPEWLAFDPIALAPKLRAPTLIVHSEQAAIPDGARRFYDRLTVTKDIAWIPGTQFDFYDQHATVTEAVDRAVTHIARHLDVPINLDPASQGAIR